MATKIQLRRDSAANWAAADPVLYPGEAGVELDTGRVKVGDGSSAWSALRYFDDETVYTASSGAFDRADGGIQTLTLTANSTLSIVIDEGQSALLKITGGDTYSITWPAGTWRTNNGSPPDPAAVIFVEMLKLDGELLMWAV